VRLVRWPVLLWCKCQVLFDCIHYYPAISLAAGQILERIQSMKSQIPVVHKLAEKWLLDCSCNDCFGFGFSTVMHLKTALYYVIIYHFYNGIWLRKWVKPWKWHLLVTDVWKTWPEVMFRVTWNRSSYCRWRQRTQWMPRNYSEPWLTSPHPRYLSPDCLPC